MSSEDAPVSDLHTWCTPQDFLDNVEPIREKASYRFYYENEFKSLREGWVLCKYARLAYKNRQYKIRICDDQFPDGQLLLNGGADESIIDYEITQAFKRPEELAKNKLPGNGGLTLDKLEDVFMESLLSAIEKKALKHYSVPVNLLVYVTNISTWGAFYDIIVENQAKFEPYRKRFKTLSILATSAVRAVQIFPEFKEY